MAKRVVGCIVAGAAAFALMPAAVLADQPFSGSASTATLSVSIDPNALLTLPSADIPAQVSSLLVSTLPTINAQVDGAHSTGTRSGTAADLSAGHADVTPISLQLSSLNTMLGNLDSALQTLWGDVKIPALQATLADVATITGNVAVMAALPPTLASELGAFNTQLSTLNHEIATLPDVLPQAIDELEGLIANATQGLTADLNSAHPTGQNSSALSVTVPPAVPLPPLVPSLPVVASLTPFSAVAVNAAGAHALGASGPQAASNEGTANINIAPVMDLTGLRTALTTLQTTLQQVNSSIATIEPQLAGVAAIINPVLPGGLSLSAIASQATAALTPVNQLTSLVQALQLDGALACNDQGTLNCSLGSTSVVPQGAGVHATAISKVVDLSVLQMSPALASAIGAPAVTGTPLLDVQGLQATADSFIDGSNGDQTTSSGLTHLAIAGVAVIDNGQIIQQSLSGSSCQPNPSGLPSGIPVGEPMTLCLSTPAGDITVIITVGAPQTTYSGSAHRAISLTKAEIRLLNGAPDGTHALQPLGTTQAGTIASVDMGAVSSEVLGASLVPASESGSNVVMEQTGMFGSGSLVIGFGLLFGGFALRRASRRPRGRRAS
jgi:hypothetical protein